MESANRFWLRWLVLLVMLFATSISAQVTSNQQSTTAGEIVSSPVSIHGRPAIITIKELADFEALPAVRKNLIEIAIALAAESPWLPYLYGSADPAMGGLDCSGAMYYVMKRAGLTPPRSAAAQYCWFSQNLRLHLVAEDAVTDDHASLRWLKPGDLLFWSTHETPVTTEHVNITHVAMYLGPETRDARKIMINATDGRSYRGVKANGYGIYDFRIAAKGSKSKLIGYGTPPGIPEIVLEPAVVPESSSRPQSGNAATDR